MNIEEMTVKELKDFTRQFKFEYIGYENGRVDFIIPYLNKFSPTLFIATVKNNNFLKHEYQKELEIIYKHLIEIGR